MENIIENLKPPYCDMVAVSRWVLDPTLKNQQEHLRKNRADDYSPQWDKRPREGYRNSKNDLFALFLAWFGV